MRRLQVLRFLSLLFVVFLAAGCANLPTRTYESSLPKTNKIFVATAEMFKDIKMGMNGIKDIGKPIVDDLYYKEVIEEYATTLKAELARSGFVVVETPTHESLVIKTKIGDNPPPLGGWLGIYAMGTVGVQIEVFQNEKLVFYFEEGANTTIGYKTKKQITRLIPRIVQKLKKKFLLKEEARKDTFSRLFYLYPKSYPHPLLFNFIIVIY